TLAFVSGKLGKKSLFIYLFSIIITSLLFGLIVDHIWKISGEDMNLITGGMKMLPMWLKIFSAVILSGLMIRAIGKNLSNKFLKKNKEIIDMKGNYTVQDMTCQHCVNTIENALKPIQGIENINISLHDKRVQIDGEYDEKEVITAVQKAGYSIEKNKEK
ncbi:MAG: heavy-metal-associated domain-containing protein, partial [Candidatus Cloacimonetes bacterium]|nr:heavy-metal-associated domain-containing protein [Candidatus Cloacimonadota bacterium]